MGHMSPPPPSPGRSECRFEEGGCTRSEIPEWGPSPLSDHSLEEGPPEAGGGGWVSGRGHNRRSRERWRKRRRRRGRGRPGLGLGAASPWAGPEQVLGAFEAGGGRREGLHPAGSHSPLSFRAPFLPSSAQPLSAGPCIPVALSNLGRKRFQKAQAWARSPRRTSSGRRFRLTYCCAPAVYGGHCGTLGSRGSLGSLRKEREGSASGKPAPPALGTVDWRWTAGGGRLPPDPSPLWLPGEHIPSFPTPL